MTATDLGHDHRRWLFPLLVVTSLGLSLRLLWLIDAHAVNVLYWDQWDFFEALFDDASLWETFRWQHGPHRQGLGFLLTRAVADLSAWDSRADALTSGLIIICASALFLWLRARLCGPLDPGALAIPLLVLTPAQYGIFLHTPNASHGAVPLLLVALYALALTLHGTILRITSLVVLNFLLIHTGFGLFAGVITPLFFALDCVRGPARAIHLVALAAALLSGAFFFVGYTWDPAASHFELAAYYPRFIALMLANVLGVKGTGFVPTLIGMSLAIAGLAIAGLRIRAILRGSDAPIDRVIVFLIGFSFLFTLAAAIGRVETGFPMAQSTRYVPLTVPFLLGIILHCLAMRPRPLRVGLVAGITVGLVAATFPMREAEARFMQRLSAGKRIWVEVYRDTHEIATADRSAGLKIYPWPPETTRLQSKLDYLEAQGLNLFKK